MRGRRGFKYELFGEVRFITDLDYADGLVLLSSTLADAQLMLLELAKVAGDHGLQINFGPAKTEHLQAQATTVGLRTPAGKEVHVVPAYKYLGSVVEVSPDSSRQDWLRRKGQSWAALRKLRGVWRSNLRCELKVKIFVSRLANNVVCV